MQLSGFHCTNNDWRPGSYWKLSPKFHKILPDFRNWKEKMSNNGRWRYLPFVLLYLNACVYLAPLRRYGTSKIIGSRPWPFGVTWPFDSRGPTSYGWSIVTMHLSGTVMEIWLFEVLPGRLFQEQRSVVSWSSILHWSHILLFATLGT